MLSMKRTVALLLLMEIFVPVSISRAAEPDAKCAADLTATQIIDKSRAAYAALQSYRGFSVVASDMAMQSKDVNFQDAEGSTTRIEFKRGQYLRLSGVDSKGKKFRGLVSPTENWMELERQADEEGNIKREIVQGIPDFSAREYIAASLHGISIGTASLVPDALFAEEEESNVMFPKLTDVKLQGSEKNGH